MGKGQRPQVEARSKYVREKRLCLSDEGEPCDGRDQTIVLHLDYSFKCVQNGFQGFV
jgi:hypothetical protein